MSLQTQHDPKNEAEITTGIALAAAVGSNANNLRTSSWVRSCKSNAGASAAATGRACCHIGCGPARARSRSPSALALPGRCWALTFQRRCWRAVPSGWRRGVHRILADAGFQSVMLAPRDFDRDIACGGGIEEALEAAMALGPISRALQDRARKRVPRLPRRSAARCNPINAVSRLRLLVQPGSSPRTTPSA